MQPINASSLLALRNDRLKHILRRCGFTVSGNKKEMVERILEVCSLPSTTFAPSTIRRTKASHKRRILSIDLGIKNISICQLTVPYRPFSPSQRLSAPDILAWERFSVIERYMSETSCLEDKRKKAQSTCFRSDNFSEVAVRLAQDLLSQYSPDVILLETQRARTSGGSAVQEWTLRVNMLEQMLHAVFRLLCLKREWQGNIFSMSPKQVASYWLEEGSASRKASSKAFKTSVVRRWLSNGGDISRSPVRLDKSLLELATNFTKRRGNSGKLDDLADSILQGVTFVKWEHNRARLRDGDLELDGD